MIVAIVGSRSFTDYDKFKKVIDPFGDKITKIVSGGASGADCMAEYYANDFKIPVEIIYPDWKKYGKAAGPIRNRQIVEMADYIVLFWDGISRGTKSTLDICKELKKDYRLIYV